MGGSDSAGVVTREPDVSLPVRLVLWGRSLLQGYDGTPRHVLRCPHRGAAVGRPPRISAGSVLRGASGASLAALRAGEGACRRVGGDPPQGAPDHGDAAVTGYRFPARRRVARWGGSRSARGRAGRRPPGGGRA